ncbi:undecaprenyl-diphosphatase [Paenibacillus hodogayensis]|uniref:Undecaprenyl-diphosphatase n=1 Tax=Paenibacillus hodogayensis TaxID=279208 RepID=A0ABV5W731_9BACL
MISLLQIDYDMFRFINGLAGHSNVLDGTMRFFSQQAEYLFFIGILVYWLTRSKTNRLMVLEALTSACTAFGVGFLVSHIVYRDRPFVVHSVHQLIEHAANASFPSDHAIGAFVISVSIWTFRRKEGWVWLGLAVCIAFSRIWTGVHYPTDVMMGAIIGVVSSIFIHFLFAKSRYIRTCTSACLTLWEKLERRLGIKWGA